MEKTEEYLKLISLKFLFSLFLKLNEKDVTILQEHLEFMFVQIFNYITLNNEDKEKKLLKLNYGLDSPTATSKKSFNSKFKRKASLLMTMNKTIQNMKKHKRKDYDKM